MIKYKLKDYFKEKSYYNHIHQNLYIIRGKFWAQKYRKNNTFNPKAIYVFCESKLVYECHKTMSL